MKLNRLVLTNYRSFEQLELHLDEQMTVLVGSNGAGKSSVLDAVATLLSWLPARVRSKSSSGHKIREVDIRNASASTLLQLEATEQCQPLNWQLAKGRPGRPTPAVRTELAGLQSCAERIQHEIDSQGDVSIPVLAYYPVDRAVLDIPLRIRKAHDFELLEAWDDALVGGASFRSFFEWFRNREDLENETLRDQLKSSAPVLDYQDSQLATVRRAWETLIPEFSGFTVRRRPLRMTVMKNGEELRIEQLSDGEKCMIAMVGDLARRLAIANPTADDALLGEGIVLIDEADLHLHPAWQRRLVTGLARTFKNCQFILTTHSPASLTELPAQQIRVLQQGSVSTPEQGYGLSVNDILDGTMLEGEHSILSRSSIVEQQLDDIARLIDDEHFAQARQQIEQLEVDLNGPIPELVELKAMIFMLEED